MGCTLTVPGEEKWEEEPALACSLLFLLAGPGELQPGSGALRSKAAERTGRVQLSKAKCRQGLVPGYMPGGAALLPPPGAVQCAPLRHWCNQGKKDLHAL